VVEGINLAAAAQEEPSTAYCCQFSSRSPLGPVKKPHGYQRLRTAKR
jgi:hypothetical protein